MRCPLHGMTITSIVPCEECRRQANRIAELKEDVRQLEADDLCFAYINLKKRIAELEVEKEKTGAWHFKTLKKINAYESFIEKMVNAYPIFRDEWDEIQEVCDE